VGITLEPAWLLRVATPVNCGEIKGTPDPDIRLFAGLAAYPVGGDAGGAAAPGCG